METTWQNYIAFACMGVISLIAASAPLHKYVHRHALEIAIDVLLFAGIVALPAIADIRFAQSKWLLIALLTVFFAEAIFVYPIADAHKAFKSGSDQDDALVEAAGQLRGGKYPYAYQTYLGNPISDGPGWVILQIPVTRLRLYALENPLIIAIAAWILRRRSRRSAFLFVGLLILSPAIHLLVCNGSDIPLLSIAFLLLCLTIYKRTTWASILWIILCGLIVTARINLIAVPIGMLLLRRDWRTARAWIESIAAMAIAVALHCIY